MKRKLIGCFWIFLFVVWTVSANAWQESENKHVIYVSSISWHTGIVIPANSLPENIWTEGHDYSEAPYVEIGWGEADFYPADGFNLWYAFKSVFWPTASVLHFNPIYQEIEDYYFDTKVVQVEVDDEQLQRIIRYIVEEMELDENGKILPAEAGFHANSYFYEGKASYYFPKNSNVWIARALKKAGFDISPIWYQTTGLLLNKAENFGKLVVDKQ